MLERMTHTGFPERVLNRSRELLATHRRFSYLLTLKQSGVTFPRNPDPALDDDMAITCPACPNPGINFKLEEVTKPDEPFVSRYWMSYDGNFRNPRKAKKTSEGDVCLTSGRMYYVDQVAYKKWIESLPGSNNEKQKHRPECDNHKAAQGKFIKWGGLDVTGVGALTCTRHSVFLPRGFVDFFKGEQYPYADYAFASAYCWLSRHGKFPVGMTYDIWCHWIVNFLKRALNLPFDISLPDDWDLIGGIPKSHLIGHIVKCWIRYSLNNMRFVGRMEGEGVERAWAYLNETSGSTSEKCLGARWDAINLILNNWNFDKLIRMSSFLVGKYQDAVKMYIRQSAVFKELDESLPTNLTESWRSVSIEPIETSPGNWTSPFHTAEKTGGKFHATIKEGRDKESPTSTDASQKVGVTKWLSLAIELEYSMELVRREIKKMGSDPTPRQHNLINDKRKSLSERQLSFRAKQDTYMGNMDTPDHPDIRRVHSSDPEHAELGLPSSYLPGTLRGSNLETIVRAEIPLRRSTCDDSLDDLKNQLGANTLLLKYKRKNVRGEGATTRAEAALAEHGEKVSRAQWRYNNSRAALLRLSKEKSDQDTYQRIEKEDLKLLTAYLEEESANVGQGYRSISWIWRSRAAPNDKDWQVEALRVEWFRSRQRYMQWEDELKLLKREMVMTIRDFETRARAWDFKSKCDSLQPGMAEYAARKSWFFSELKTDAMNRCLELIKDPIVELSWVSDWVSKLEGKKAE
ncbi:hypothetical protein FS749_011297 [Ceratobasidium sp. UAMH 11750]|nr:hypothetical protein FS749_011297 [Ceratobasidium sp. UAMH 11750]